MEDIHKITRAIKEAVERVLTYLSENMLLKASAIEAGPYHYSLVELIHQAHSDWVHAKKLFEEVHDPDLVDHAIYSVEAAEKKYMYLIKEARRENIINEEISYPRNRELA